MWKGTLSTWAKCRGGRTVKVWRVVPGPDRLKARTTTQSTGALRVRMTFRHGKYYATVAPAARTGVDCRGAKSPQRTL